MYEQYDGGHVASVTGIMLWIRSAKKNKPMHKSKRKC